MLNRKWLKYLFDSRKVTWIFVAVVYLGLVFAQILVRDYSETFAEPLRSACLTAMLCSMGMCYGLPPLLFSFVHRRSSSDLYMTLPISRREMLWTTLFFAFLLPGTLYTVSILLLKILPMTHGYLSLALAGEMIGFALIAFAVMLLVNSACYLLANNIFDGIVMMAAYSLIPAVIYMASDSFFDTIILGSQNFTAGIISNIGIYLSPIVMIFENHYALLSKIHNWGYAEIFTTLYFILPLVFGGVSVYLLKKHFIERASERAGQVSDHILAYPLIINVYLVCCLLALAGNVVANGHQISYLQESIIVYLILLFVYVFAMFVYRRKIVVTWRILLRYAVYACVTLAICFAGWTTRGFGLSYDRNPFRSHAVEYVYECNMDYGEEAPYFVSFDLRIESKDKEKYQEVINLLEDYRNDQIDAYYGRADDDSRMYGTSFDVKQWSAPKVQGKSVYYKCYSTLTLEDLKKVSEYTDVYVDDYDGTKVKLAKYLEEHRDTHFE